MKKAKWGPTLGIKLNNKLLLSLFSNLVNQIECTTPLNPNIINPTLLDEISNFMISKPLELEHFVVMIYSNSPNHKTPPASLDIF